MTMSIIEQSWSTLVELSLVFDFFFSCHNVCMIANHPPCYIRLLQFVSVSYTPTIVLVENSDMWNHLQQYLFPLFHCIILFNSWFSHLIDMIFSFYLYSIHLIIYIFAQTKQECNIVKQDKPILSRNEVTKLKKHTDRLYTNYGHYI